MFFFYWFLIDFWPIFEYFATFFVEYSITSSVLELTAQMKNSKLLVEYTNYILVGLRPPHSHLACSRAWKTTKLRFWAFFENYPIFSWWGVLFTQTSQYSANFIHNALFIIVYLMPTLKLIILIRLFILNDSIFINLIILLASYGMDNHLLIYETSNFSIFNNPPWFSLVFFVRSRCSDVLLLCVMDES